MKKSLLPFLALLFCLKAYGFSTPCVVDYPHEFIFKFHQWAGGGCKTNLPPWVQSYKEHFPDAGSVSTLYFTGSMEILKGEWVIPAGNRPLLMIAKKGASVRFAGSSLKIKGSNVVIENISWRGVDGTAIRVEGNNVVLKNIRLIQSGSKKDPALFVLGNNVSLIDSEVEGSPSDGIVIGHATTSSKCNANLLPMRPKNIFIIDTKIHNNGQHGIVTQGYGVEVLGRKMEGAIYDNAGSGIAAHACVSRQPHTLLVSKVSFYGNASLAIQTEGPVLPAPQGVVAIPDPEGNWVVSGHLPLSQNLEDPYSLGKVAPRNLSVEIYGNFEEDRPQGRFYLGQTESVNADGTFSAFIPKTAFVIPAPYRSTGQAPAGISLSITALAIDRVLKVSSSFSAAAGGTDGDADGDGLTDIQEQESDPRNPDSDMDGLSDGRERALKLNPSDADTDGDCLPDGLEMGVGKESILELRKKILGSLPFLQISDMCRQQAEGTGALKPENGIWTDGEKNPGWNNLIGLFDADSQTTSNPLNPDSDTDGTRDGDEDKNLNGKLDAKESGADNKDSDGDGLIDGEEMRLGLQADNPDTDGDGLKDGDETHRWRSDPLQCDSDSDGLGDGLEAGVVLPEAATPECRGLQPAKTNFHDIKQLDPIDEDSDKDGLKDGEEDANHNGWLDFNETDPSLADTDGDGIADGLEKTLDRNGDGFIDFELQHLKNGEKCSPPSDKNDLDCDGVTNGRDEDADDDGCLDSDEGMHDKNENGVLDVWEFVTKSCTVAPNGSSGNGGFSGPGSTGSSNGPSSSENEGPLPPQEVLPSRGGGACQLSKDQDHQQNLALAISVLSILIILGFLRLSRSR